MGSWMHCWDNDVSLSLSGFYRSIAIPVQRWGTAKKAQHVILPRVVGISKIRTLERGAHSIRYGTCSKTLTNFGALHLNRRSSLLHFRADIAHQFRTTAGKNKWEHLEASYSTFV